MVLGTKAPCEGGSSREPRGKKGPCGESPKWRPQRVAAGAQVRSADAAEAAARARPPSTLRGLCRDRSLDGGMEGWRVC